jgi:hypothetical protein
MSRSPAFGRTPVLSIFRPLAVFIFLFGASLPAPAVTLDIGGTLSISGQTYNLGPSGTLVFDISGPIPTTLTQAYSISITNDAPRVSSADIRNGAAFVSGFLSTTVDGGFAAVDTNNCNGTCGLSHPGFGGIYTVSDMDRLLTITYDAHGTIINGPSLPADDLLSINYAITFGIPNGLSASLVTPLPASFRLFATGLGLVGAMLASRRSSFKILCLNYCERCGPGPAH